MRDGDRLLGMTEVDRITMMHSIKSLFTCTVPGSGYLSKLWNA
jgi:hypothetical protein